MVKREETTPTVEALPVDETLLMDERSVNRPVKRSPYIPRWAEGDSSRRK